MLAHRINTLIDNMKAAGVTNTLVSEPASINYYVGYITSPGERFLLLNVNTEGKSQLYLNDLFPPAHLSAELQEVVDVINYHDGQPIIKTLAEHIQPGPTGVDKYMPSQFLIQLMNEVEDLQPEQNFLVDDQRGVKDEEELELMRQSSRINDQAMERLMARVEEGLPENEMVDYLLQTFRELGATGISFEPIIAYGPNGADPHHNTNNDTPDYGDTVIMDIGAMYNGYASDMTRTVFFGQPSDEALKVHETVYRAAKAARDMVKPGVKFSDLDKAARDIITEAGYGKFFTHRLGHFIGQECHEYGDVSQYNDRVVQPGNVFSIEPGIYLPGKLGVRIEDLVIATEDGHEVINHITREPLIIEPKK